MASNIRNTHIKTVAAKHPKVNPLQDLSLERFFLDPNLFNLPTATPLQRALCRIAQGVPLAELASHPHVVSGLGYAPGTVVPDMPRPRKMVILSGIRTAKSLFVACNAVYAALTCDVKPCGVAELRKGEYPRVYVVSLKKETAEIVFNHIVGTVMASPVLSQFVLGEPTQEKITILHPTGVPIDIVVTPLDRAGGSLVGRWCAGCIFDEAPRMAGQQDGVRNYDDTEAAVIHRLLKGAQVMAIGSPWAPYGPIYEVVEERWGKPGKDVVVVKAPGPHMNPFYWTEEAVEEAKANNQIAYRTDVLAEFVDAENAMFEAGVVEQATRASPMHLEPDFRFSYVAAMDPATRQDSWTFVMCTKLPNGKKAVAYHTEFLPAPGLPLKPVEVLARIALACKKYNVDHIYTDQWAADALKDIANAFDISLSSTHVTASSKVAMFENMRTEFLRDHVELPPDPVLKRDLVSIKKRATANGLAIHVPRGGKRHADYASALALCLSKYVDEPSPMQIPAGTTMALDAEAFRFRLQTHMAALEKAESEAPEGLDSWLG